MAETRAGAQLARRYGSWWASAVSHSVWASQPGLAQKFWSMVLPAEMGIIGIISVQSSLSWKQRGPLREFWERSCLWNGMVNLASGGEPNTGWGPNRESGAQEPLERLMLIPSDISHAECLSCPIVWVPMYHLLGSRGLFLTTLPYIFI